MFSCMWSTYVGIVLCVTWISIIMALIFSPRSAPFHKHLSLYSVQVLKDFFVCGQQLYSWSWLFFFHLHSFSSLSYDRSKASSKASSPHSAIQSFCFILQLFFVCLSPWWIAAGNHIGCSAFFFLNIYLEEHSNSGNCGVWCESLTQRVWLTCGNTHVQGGNLLQ
jgi:hypothetical protein